MPAAILPTPRGPSAFLYRDPEGARASNGARYHAAVDWFAAGGTPVRSPVDGKVVEVRASRGTTGQVFGGTVKVQEEGTGRVYVCRHVEPDVSYGEAVQTGERIATVTPWRDGADHVHLEVWRTLGGGYRLENMIDPGALTWTAYGHQEAHEVKPPPRPPHGATLRLTVGERTWAGWTECTGPLKWIAAHGLREPEAAIAWRGNVWRGPRDVANVARSLVRRYL